MEALFEEDGLDYIIETWKLNRYYYYYYY